MAAKEEQQQSVRELQDKHSEASAAADKLKRELRRRDGVIRSLRTKMEQDSNEARRFRESEFCLLPDSNRAYLLFRPGTCARPVTLLPSKGGKQTNRPSPSPWR